MKADDVVKFVLRHLDNLAILTARGATVCVEANKFGRLVITVDAEDAPKVLGEEVTVHNLVEL
jgi:archaeosine-15-forming tRNA-guanine transglycosylase